MWWISTLIKYRGDINPFTRIPICIGFVKISCTVYPKKYAHGFVVLCFVVVMQSFIMNSHEVFIHIHQGCFAGTGAIVRLPLCQWSKPDGYGKISQCITTTKHSKAKTVRIFLGIYCTLFIGFVQIPCIHLRYYSRNKSSICIHIMHYEFAHLLQRRVELYDYTHAEYMQVWIFWSRQMKKTTSWL